MRDTVLHLDNSADGSGVEKFTLEAERVVITVSVLGTSSEKIFRLTNLSPECEISKRRFGALYLVPLVLAAVFSFATWRIANLSGEEMRLFARFTGWCVPGFLYYAIKGFKPLEVTRFFDKAGGLAFELVETKKTRFKYADFVSELKRRIAQRNWK